MSIIKRLSTLPLDWLNEKRNNVNRQMIDYLTPLIQGEVHVRFKDGIPEHIKLY